MVSCENANRAGVLANITLQDLSASAKMPGKRAIHIADHKTVGTYGGAILNVTESLYQQIWKYVRGAREGKGSGRYQQLFLAKSGLPLTPSNIHHALKLFAEKTLVLDEEKMKKFSNTFIRKTTVTNTRTGDINQSSDIASLMEHSLQTADRSYDRIEENLQWTRCYSKTVRRRKRRRERR